METQCCNVVPTEDGFDMYPGTQWMDLCQVAASAALNIPSNKYERQKILLRYLQDGKLAKKVINRNKALKPTYT